MQHENNNKGIRIGVHGGAQTIGVGSTLDVIGFFSNIKHFVDWSYSDNKKYEELICDRLYKRYIRLNELKATNLAINFIENELSKKQKHCPMLNIFQEFFSAYRICSESAFYFYERDNDYSPLMICISTMPHCVIDIERSLEKYDTLDGPPFWTRFYLKELYDQGKDMPELPF